MSAHNTSISLIPHLITHSAPHIVQADLHTPFKMVDSTCESNFSLSTTYHYKLYFAQEKINFLYLPCKSLQHLYCVDNSEHLGSHVYSQTVFAPIQCTSHHQEEQDHFQDRMLHLIFAWHLHYHNTVANNVLPSEGTSLHTTDKIMAFFITPKQFRQHS